MYHEAPSILKVQEAMAKELHYRHSQAWELIPLPANEVPK